MIKKILVAVDGSPHSVKAVRLASDLASKYGAEVILLHVLLRGHMPAGLKKALEVEVGAGRRPTADNLVNLPQEIMARVESRSQLSIAELDYIAKYVLSSVEAVCREAGVEKVTRQVEEGSPAEIIVEFAKKAAVDMIVMGSRGLSDWRGILVGSVSHKVTNMTPCTCVTVR